MSDQKLETPVLEALRVLLNAGIFHKDDPLDSSAWLIDDKVQPALDDIYGESLLPVLQQQSMLPARQEDWEKKFIDLIVQAQVPIRLEGSNGDVYYANKYSDSGMKAFKAALKRGVIFDVLVKSVMLYYKSNVRYKKAIGNYFAQGDWRTDYEALLSTVAQGPEALHQHIKQETKDGQRSQYKIG